MTIETIAALNWHQIEAWITECALDWAAVCGPTVGSDPMLLRTFVWLYGVTFLLSMLIERAPPMAIAP
jgi:hypothetical protein